MGLRLYKQYSLWQFTQFEVDTLRGIHVKRGGGAIAKETIDLWKFTAKEFYKSRTKKPNKNQIYIHVFEKHKAYGAKKSTVNKHLKEYVEELINK